MTNAKLGLDVKFSDTVFRRAMNSGRIIHKVVVEIIYYEEWIQRTSFRRFHNRSPKPEFPVLGMTELENTEPRNFGLGAWLFNLIGELLWKTHFLFSIFGWHDTCAHKCRWSLFWSLDELILLHFRKSLIESLDWTTISTRHRLKKFNPSRVPLLVHYQNFLFHWSGIRICHL